MREFRVVIITKISFFIKIANNEVIMVNVVNIIPIVINP
jgi:hypothetical protein